MGLTRRITAPQVEHVSYGPRPSRYLRHTRLAQRARSLSLDAITESDTDKALKGEQLVAVVTPLKAQFRNMMARGSSQLLLRRQDKLSTPSHPHPHPHHPRSTGLVWSGLV